MPAEEPIGIRLDVGGVKECQQQMSAAAQSVRAMQSALKLADSEFKLTGDATAMYTSKIQTLQAQIAAQNQAVEAARQGLQHMSEAYGASSSQAMQWQSKLNTAQTGLNNMTASLRDMQSKLAESTSAMSGTAGAADALSGALSGMAGGSYSMDGLNTSLGATQGEIQKTREQLGDLQEQVKETGGLFYNVGNMSISAANGGKVASAITGIAKEITSLVKSSGETAQNTGGLLNGGGGVTAGGVMSTVGGIVSNFGPWGAVAGAVLNMGGAIIDNLTAINDMEKISRREAERSSTVGNLNMDRLSDLISQRQEVTATLDADVQAQVTAKVDGLRVIIDEITEDGKVNSREVGSVRKYVQEVLMADYDEAVEDLYRMRGELWILATQGFSAEEVAAFTVNNGDPEQSALFAFLKAGLTDPDIAWSKAQQLYGDKVDTTAARMWLWLSKKFGSSEAVTAAFQDPAQRSTVEAAVSEWMREEFKGDITPAEANLFAANLMTKLGKTAAEGFAGTNMTVSADWFKTTKGGGFFTTWVQTVLGADQKEAEAKASQMWVDLMTSCANPSDAANALWQSSGEEAAAAYQSGEKSDTANAFGAMVAWVKANLGADETAAIAIAKEMWDNLRKAASYGTTDGTVLTPDTSWIEGTEAGTMFTDYVAKLLGDENSGDYADAMAKAKGMWEAVIAACSSPEAAISAIENSTGEEAAAAYQAGEQSEEAQAFGALLAYVQERMPEADKETAIKTAIGMWDAVRLAVFEGTDDSGVDHRTALTKKITFSGSTAMRQYISERMGTDFDTAINQVNDYWDRLVAAMNGETSAEEGSPMRATLLQQALSDYKGTIEEIKGVTEKLPDLTGSALDEKIAELEALLDRAEQLANRIELLRGDELTQAEGAYKLVTYGHGNFDEDDVASALAYLDTMAKVADQSYAEKIQQAKAEQRTAYADPKATAETKSKADAAYETAKQEAEAAYEAAMQEYGVMISDLFEAMIPDYLTGDNRRAAAVKLLQGGFLSGVSTSYSKYFGDGYLNETLQWLANEAKITTRNPETHETVGGAAPREGVRGVRLDNKTYDYTIQGLDEVFHGLEELPIYEWISEYVKQHWSQDPLIEDTVLAPMPAPNSPENAPAPDEQQQKFLETTMKRLNEQNGAKLPSDFDDTDAQAAMAEAGKNLSDTLAASIDANAPTAEAAGTRLGQNVAAAVRAALQIASPSKLMMEYGAFTAEGLAEGIDAGITRVARASGRMAAAVARPVASAAATSGPTYNNTATSSLFVENYYQRSDADIDVLAASIADKNRLTRMGNGLRT